MSRKEVTRVTLTKNFCDFCGKCEDEVEQLITGPQNASSSTKGNTICICCECVELCVEIVAEAREKKNGEFPDDPPG